MGVMLSPDPIDSRQDSFLKYVLDSKGDNTRIGIKELMEQWFEEFGESASIGIMESYGQEKLHRYPIGSTEGGHQKMYKYGTSIRLMDFKLIDETLGAFVREFTWNFFKKHHKLPKIVPSTVLDPRILSIFAKEIIPSRHHIYVIPVLEWAKVVFKKKE